MWISALAVVGYGSCALPASGCRRRRAGGRAVDTDGRGRGRAVDTDTNRMWTASGRGHGLDLNASGRGRGSDADGQTTDGRGPTWTQIDAARVRTQVGRGQNAHVHL